MDNSEYGGFFSLENVGKEYYVDDESYFLRRMNAARYAISDTVDSEGFKHIYVPFYMCPSVKEELEKRNILYTCYHISDDFMPMISSVSSDSVIMIPGYYGIFPRYYFENMISKYNNIIFDFTQSFYTKPFLSDGVYNVYSPRKFFGVTDGAYLISTSNKANKQLPKDYSANRYLFVLDAAEKGTNANYPRFLSVEKELSDAGPREMSETTRRMLSIIDYDSIKCIRKRNFAIAHSLVGDYNLLCDYCDQVLNDNNACPMVYPCLVNRNGDVIRKRLVENRVYVSQWWKAVLLDDESNPFEKRLSENLIPLPIDQRYEQADIIKICGKLIDLL